MAKRFPAGRSSARSFRLTGWRHMASPFEQPRQSKLPETDMKNLLPDPPDRIHQTAKPTRETQHSLGKVPSPFDHQANSSLHGTKLPRTYPPLQAFPLCTRVIPRKQAEAGFVCVRDSPSEESTQSDLQTCFGNATERSAQYGTRSDLANHFRNAASDSPRRACCIGIERSVTGRHSSR